MTKTFPGSTILPRPFLTGQHRRAGLHRPAPRQAPRPRRCGRHRGRLAVPVPRDGHDRSASPDRKRPDARAHSGGRVCRPSPNPSRGLNNRREQSPSLPNRTGHSRRPQPAHAVVRAAPEQGQAK